MLHVTVKDADARAVGRRFSGAVVELALASVPGFFPTAPPGDGTPYGVFREAWVDASAVPAEVTHDDGTAETVHSVHDHGPSAGRGVHSVHDHGSVTGARWSQRVRRRPFQTFLVGLMSTKSIEKPRLLDDPTKERTDDSSSRS